MDDRVGTYVFLAPELEQILIDNEISFSDLITQTGQNISVALQDDPAQQEGRQKEPVTIILASAAIVAALTPTLREIIRRIARRDPVIRDRVLVPVETSDGKQVLDAEGKPILHWVDKAVGIVPDVRTDASKIKGLFGIEITLGGEAK